MGFRDPVTSAGDVDTRVTPAGAGVRMYEDNSDPAAPRGVVEFTDGFANDAPAQLTQHAEVNPRTQALSQGGGVTVKSGSYGGVTGPQLDLQVAPDGAGGTKRTATLSNVDAVDLAGKLITSTAAPTYAGAVLVANATSPVTASKSADGWVRLRGLMSNTASVSNVAGTWFTLPTGYRPSTPEIATVYLEGGGLASCQINTDGTVVGLLLAVGGYPIPTPRYWSFDTEFPTT